jgi:hypothetical protein
MIRLTETREITPDVTSACASAKAQATRAKDSHQKVIPLECQPDLDLPPPYEAAAMGCPFPTEAPIQNDPEFRVG